MNKTLIWIIVIVVVVLAGYFLVNKQEPSSGESIKIGGLFGITGYAAFSGEAARDGFLMAIEDSDTNVPYVIEDHQSNTKNVVTAAKKLTEIDKVLVVIGPEWAEFGEVIVPVANEKKILFISPWVTVEEEWTKSPYYFKATPTERNQIRAVIDHMTKTGVKNIVLFYSNNTWSFGHVNIIKNELDKKDIKIIDELKTNQESNDYRAEITKIKSLKPDAVWAIVATDDGQGIFSKQMSELGVNTKIYIPEGRAMSTVMRDRFGQYLAGILYPTTKRYQRMAEFDEKFEKRFSRKPGAISGATSYDMTTLVLMAIKDGAKNTEDIRDYLLNIKDYNGYSNKISFNKDGRVVAPEEIVIMRVVATGDEIVD